jgi:hypothetical protein
VGANITPSINDTYKLGTSTVRWLDSNTTSTYTNRVENVSVADLTLAGVNLRCNGNLIPNANNAYTLGTSSLRWSTSDVLTTRSDNINNSTTNSDIVVTAAVGKDIKVGSSVLPTVDNTHSIGTNSARFLRTFSNNYHQFDFQSVFFQASSFSATTSWTDVTGFTKNTNSPYYDAGQNDNFKIPSKGLYLITFTSNGDTDPVTPNYLDWRLRNSGTTVTSQAQPQLVGDPLTTISSLTVNIVWECQSAGEVLRMQAKSSTATTTGVRLTNGRIFQVQTWV